MAADAPSAGSRDAFAGTSAGRAHTALDAARRVSSGGDTATLPAVAGCCGGDVALTCPEF